MEKRAFTPAASALGETNVEMLDRFPQVFSYSSEIAKHQLGWRMAILPFRSVGAPGGYEIAFGMAEEISASIARFRSPRLMATATFWDGTGPADDVLGRCRMYELDYMMDGTINVTGTRVRLNAVLLDVVLDFEVIWAGTFDGDLTDLFTLQNDVAAEAVRQLDPDLYSRGPTSQAPVRTQVAAAHYLVLNAIQAIYRLDRIQFMRAHDSLLQAIKLDPDYAAAHAWLAYWSVMAVGQGWVRDPKDVTALAGLSADRAVELDPSDARALSIGGHVKGYFLHDVQSALAMHARAIELNPNLPIAWTLSSVSKIYNGEHATAIRHAQIARSLSPRDPHIFFNEHALMFAHLLKRDLDEANSIADVVIARNPGHASALNVRLAILGHLGRRDESDACLASLTIADPCISVAKIVARAPLTLADRAFYEEGLRLAGVPA